MVSAAFLFGIEVDFLISPYKGTFRVSQAYRNLRANGTYHQGYDLVGIGDKSIYCPVYGTVIRAGWECATLPKKGFGQRVVVRIGSTAYYMYFGHLSKINVAVGQKLKPGDLIGVEGSTGHSTGSHLHWEIRINDISTGYVSVHQYAGIPNVAGSTAYTSNWVAELFGPSNLKSPPAASRSACTIRCCRVHWESTRTVSSGRIPKNSQGVPECSRSDS